jgi:hypothetical protein
MEGRRVGVCFSKKEGKYRSYIQNNKKWEHLGFYDNESAAKAAYIKRLNELKLKNKYA